MTGSYQISSLLYCMLLMLPPLNGQISQLAGRRITHIEYQPQHGLDLSDLAKVQPIRVGDLFDPDVVSRSIDGLFSTGHFRDIAVDVEPVGEGLRVRFVTKPTWFVGSVAVRGKLPIPPSHGQIANTAQIALGTRFQDTDVDEAAKSIQRLLRENGLYEARINPHIERDAATQRVFLTFRITPGKRAKYATPTVAGDNTLSESTILRTTGWRIPVIHFWREVTDARTRAGVERLLGRYQKQGRLTARVELDKLDYDPARRRVHPSLTVKPGPKVRLNAVEAKVSKSVLKRYVPVFQERAVYEDLLIEGKRNLQDYFQGRGYYDVDVVFRVQPERQGVETIEYVISKGSRFKLMSVGVAGSHYFRTETIRERMFMQPAAFNLRHGRYSEAFRRRDQENIASLYKSNGFRDVIVTTTVDRQYKGKAGLVAATVHVNEGPQWTVAALTLNGVSPEHYDSLLTRLTSTAGQPFADVSLAADRNAILTYFYERGYLAADFKAQWRPADRPHTVTITYQITEGPRQFVRDVLVTGLNRTRRRLVEKQITLKPGDPLSQFEQTEIQKRFYDFGIFARVDTAVQNADGGTDHKYVLFDFEEANRFTVGLGLGAQLARFGTPNSNNLSSPGGSTGLSPQISLDVSQRNLFGIGHTISLRGMYSSLEKRGSLSYQQPRFLNKEERAISYNLLYEDSLSVRTFASKRQEASVQVSQKFSNSLTGLFRFSYRRVSVSNVVIPVLLVPQLVAPVRIGMLSANLVQDRRDNPTDPHHGIYNTVDIGLSARYFGSQRSFGRVLLRNATYYKLAKSVVLARQTQFGVIAPFSAPLGISEQQSVPLAERFFGGGADSLRAFPYNQAGPRDLGNALVSGGANSQPTGFPLGGNALLFNNVELRFPLLGENIQGVFFHDMGNVYSSLGNLSFRSHQRDLKDFDYAAQAVGFGIRYRTPVGPVRLDLAYGLNPPAFQGFKGTPAQLLQCNPNAAPGSLPGYCTLTRQSLSHFQFFFSIGQTF